MGAIIAVISDKLSNTTIPGHKGDVNTFINNNDKHRPEHMTLKGHCENDREIKQNVIIREIQLIEKCTSCYLEERVKILLTPWVTKSFPWDQSSELLSGVRSETKGNLYCSNESTVNESDIKDKFKYHHSASRKKSFPPPRILTSLCN